MTDSVPGWSLLSMLPGVVWPAVPSGNASRVLALLFQFEQSQWLSPADLRAQQLRQLDVLTRHAYLHSAYYSERWRGMFDPKRALDADRFLALPILDRPTAQSRYDGSFCRRSQGLHTVNFGPCPNP